MFPNYAHNCKKCKFLGCLETKTSSDRSYAKQVDIYFCPEANGGFIVGRYGHQIKEMVTAEIGSLRKKESVFGFLNTGLKIYLKTKENKDEK